MTKRESGLMKQMHLMNGVRAAAFAVGMMAVCTTTELLALDRQDVRLYVPFENALKPQLASGRVSIDFNKGKQEKVEFTDGRRGRGLLLKNDVSFSYVGKKLFEKSEGTIAFWVRPVGWQGGDGKYHWFANLFSPTSSHLFYKYGEGGQVILYVTGTGREPTTIGQNHTWDSFSEDRWTHLAMTFNSKVASTRQRIDIHNSHDGDDCIHDENQRKSIVFQYQCQRHNHRQQQQEDKQTIGKDMLPTCQHQ